jgi:ankyrin repeat protein
VGKIPTALHLIQACRSLAVLDVDGTVRLAHHTVQRFLLELPTEDSVPEFHFQFQNANIEAGETCVAYLSFSDFEVQVTVPTPISTMLSSDVPSPAAILDSASTPMGLAYIVSGAFKLGQYVRTGNARHQLPTFDLAKFIKLKKRPPPKLQEKYVFLNYAIENWVSHTSDFSEANTTMWEAFKYLAMEKPTTFDIRIWGDGHMPDDLPYTALFRWAVCAGHVPLLKLFLQLPRGSNLRDYYQREFERNESVMLRALANGHTNVVEFVTNEGCIDGVHRSPLIEAALSGNEAGVELLLEYGASLNKGASRSDDIIVMRALMKDELPLDLQTKRVQMALAEAAERGFDGVLMVLLDKAASFKVATTYLQTIWRDDVFPKAAERVLGGVMRLLLEKGADVNAKDGSGWTALHWAARRGDEALVQLLLEKGININVEGSISALHWATCNGHKAVVQLLLEGEVDINAKDDFGWTLLDGWTNSRHGTVVQPPPGQGVDANPKSGTGWTALHWAVCKGHEAVVQLLLDKGADVNAKDSIGWTALHWAARDGQEALMQLLLEKEADINMKDEGKLTALHLAARNGHEVIVQLLLQDGADVNAKDNLGLTALRSAAVGRHEAIVQLLAPLTQTDRHPSLTYNPSSP